MHREFLMGNEAIALGALSAGVQVVSGYPGTPSTEVLETVAKRCGSDVHVEWSINEKAALEVAAGAAYAGARALVTMKQVGLNVASDPLMSLEYIGVNGGLVVLVADDPGPISSQTEQDTRTFGMYSKIPVFDPSTPEEAYKMTVDAFEFSEKYSTPVIVRPTTRIDHGYAVVDIKDRDRSDKCCPEGFIKDPSRWVIFPRLSVVNHAAIEKRNAELSTVFSEYEGNTLREGGGSFEASKKGIVSQGISYAYVHDILDEADTPRLMKVGTPFPFPEELALRFLEGLEEVLVIEELDPVIERALIFVCGKQGLKVKVRGKLDGTVKSAGENSMTETEKLLKEFLGSGLDERKTVNELPPLPVRPPVLCAGCPHRASFYAVKQAMKGQKTIFCGDIGCYTLGNAKPLDMCDTCLCMGAGINIAQGVFHVEKDTKAFAFVGDSTFFASGITGAVNGFYNGADLVLVILDNSTTAMTGHQPHPGTGRRVTGEPVEAVDMESLLRGIGIKTVETVNPLELSRAVKTVKRVADEPGVKAVIFKYPCIVRFKLGGEKAGVDPDKCTACKKCINELGCPALILKDGKAFVDTSLCTGCTLCEQVCSFGAISGGEAGDPLDVYRTASKKGKVEGSKYKKKETDADGTRRDIQKETTDFEERNIVLSGVGGQGTVLASRLIASAAMNSGIAVRTAETIGMAQRGGSVFTHLRLGGSVYSPLTGEGRADLIISFEPAEAVRMLPYLKSGGTVVTSIRPVIPVSAMVGGTPYDTDGILDYLKQNVEKLVLVDADKALKELDNDRVLNTLLLGAAYSSGGLGLDKDALISSLKELLPEKLWDINIKAFRYYSDQP